MKNELKAYRKKNVQFKKNCRKMLKSEPYTINDQELAEYRDACQKVLDSIPDVQVGDKVKFIQEDSIHTGKIGILTYNWNDGSYTLTADNGNRILVSLGQVKAIK